MPKTDQRVDGVVFYDAANNREMLLVDNSHPTWGGWLMYKHPDGKWVSYRKATHEDMAKIEQAKKNALPELGEFQLGPMVSFALVELFKHPGPVYLHKTSDGKYATSVGGVATVGPGWQEVVITTWKRINKNED